MRRARITCPSFRSPPDDPETSPGRTAEDPCALPVKEKKEKKEKKEEKRERRVGYAPPHRP
jgi:hypothetical protein